MRTFVCIAGLREQTIREIHKSPARFSGKASWAPICFPIDGPLCFRAGMSDRYLSRLRREIEQLPALEPVSILLMYAAFEEPETEQFVRNFFPFSAACSFEPFDDLKCASHQKREGILKFLKNLENSINGLKNNTLQVKDKLSGQNFSPLTLPILNFRSKVFEEELNKIQKSIGYSNDFGNLLKKFINDFHQSHPLKTAKPEQKIPKMYWNKKYYEDDRGLWFISPGSAEHGYLSSHADDEHLAKCIANARSRLGGPLKPRFHYDCSYVTKNIGGPFPNCHSVGTNPNKAHYVNIAPNDAIR